MGRTRSSYRMREDRALMDFDDSDMSWAAPAPCNEGPKCPAGYYGVGTCTCGKHPSRVHPRNKDAFGYRFSHQNGAPVARPLIDDGWVDG